MSAKEINQTPMVAFDDHGDDDVQEIYLGILRESGHVEFVALLANHNIYSLNIVNVKDGMLHITQESTGHILKSIGNVSDKIESFNRVQKEYSQNCELRLATSEEVDNFISG